MQIKRMWMILVVLVMALTFTACGSTQPEETNETAAEETAADVPADEESSDDTLIVYFSAANSKDADAVTSATPMVGEESSVGWIADVISEKTGAEIVKLTPQNNYPSDYDAVADQAKQETDSDARPAFAPLDVNPEEYKNVFIGYPIWWYEMPMIMDTFFDTYDFAGVTIIPFNTHAGSQDGGTYSDISELEPNATVLDGLAISGEDAGTDSAKTSVEEWLAGLNLD